MKKRIAFFAFVSLLFSFLIIESCKKDPVLPKLTTAAVTNLTTTTFTSGGEITSDGDADVTSRGVCYSTTAAPDIADPHTTDGTGTGEFVSNVTGLAPNTLYHIRAYATNKAGTAYGNEVTATTTALAGAVLTTAEVTSITHTTAVTGGNITSDGNATVTARGVCWATTTNPTVTGSKTTDGAGTGTFVSNITGLTAGTTYYVRAYATNSVGTSYGNEVSFTATAVGLPTLTTTDMGSVTLTTATSGGNITDDGGNAISARGVCWATTANPTTANFKTTDGTGTGSFTSNLTGLTPGTLYHVRAYATNSAGTAYGNELTFTASAIQLPTLTTTAYSAVTRTTAQSGGVITADGGGAITARGVCWATTTNPVVTGSATNDGSGTGTFTSTITGLTAATTYYVRAYATNSTGTAYGNEISFTTGAAVLPTITTVEVTSITQTGATSGGDITDEGGVAITASGICWAATANPTTADSKTTDGTPSGTFASNITGLTAGATYHVRAYATNSVGTSYGDDVSFTTTSPLLPTLTTAIPSAIDLTTAVSGGTIVSDGGGAITVSGICWSTTVDPTTADSRTTNGTLTGTFTGNMTSLTPGTRYYVRAYATNSTGTGYGNTQEFSTNIADIEGNTYKTVMIGTQMWMAENLKTTQFNDGSAITNVTDNAAWAALTTSAYCWYNNNQSTYEPIYGAMYNWFAADAGNLCPTGWHVPSDPEFSTLEVYLGVPQSEVDSWAWHGTDQGSMMKNTTGWGTGMNGTNTSGFSALPGGYRYGLTGTFNNVGDLTYWWTTTPVPADPTTAWYRRLDGSSSQIYKAATEKPAGKYIRCIKD